MKSYLKIVLLGILLSSCSDTTKENSDFKSANTHALVFIDKTASVDVNKPFVAEKYQAAIGNLIEQTIKKEGDILEIYFVHENTSKARCLLLKSRTLMENLEGLNATDKEAAASTYEMSIKRERALFTRQAISKLMSSNTGSSTKETNISASLGIISKAIELGNDVAVFYFSDMVESLKNGRDFHINPPKSNDEAVEWAKKDAEKNSKLNLSGAEVTFVLPFEPTSSSSENNPNVTSYWKLYLEELGVANINEL
jgi:hypothetical protein